MIAGVFLSDDYAFDVYERTGTCHIYRGSITEKREIL
jgi:hypothetical protein